MKRAFDIIGAGVALVVSSPFLAVIALLVLVRHGRPVLFAQTRVGLHEKPFRLWKFRTMTGDCDHEGRLLPDEDRLTPFGRFLRRTSLDELPELWNVLRGEMSLVGPRPLLVEYLPLYSERQARRHEVRPGLTGLTQIRGRNELSWPERLEWDVCYVENRSMRLDIRILLETILVVVRGRGVASEGHATSPPFRGEGNSG